MDQLWVIRIIEALGLAVSALFVAWYVFKYAKPTGRQKAFLASGGVIFLPLIFILPWGPLGVNSDLMVRIAVAGLGLACIISGIAKVYYAKDAEKMWKQSRQKGKGGKWVVSNLPKRESFIMNGALLAFSGVIMISFLFLFPSKGEGAEVSYVRISNSGADMTGFRRPGDYNVNGNRIDIFLGSGSGQNTAAATRVERVDDKIAVYIDANYCGATRDLRPLVTSIRLKRVSKIDYPVEVKINPTCGKIPASRVDIEVSN